MYRSGPPLPIDSVPVRVREPHPPAPRVLTRDEIPIPSLSTSPFDKEFPMAVLQRDPRTFLFFCVVIVATFLI